tara:strand:- start:2342 stop:3172 length:831 start_codon:yes stop_codon:yes gene_type:complete
MSYKFEPDAFYRMPTHFGPSLGPRQGLNGRRYANVETPKALSVAATFSADPKQLDKLLPPGFSLREPHSVHLSFEYITECEWLAGRGYNTFGVTTPVTYRGETENVEGDLSFVLWENKADPIVTGREDLGYAKTYCELPEPQFIDDKIICRASWDGCEFAALTVTGAKSVSPDDLPRGHPSEGILNYKYIPKTWEAAGSDTEYAVLMPGDWPNTVIDEAKVAAGAQVIFRQSTWEELPTLVHIVNTFADLNIGDCISATVTKCHGAKDLSDHRRIR